MTTMGTSRPAGGHLARVLGLVTTVCISLIVAALVLETTVRILFPVSNFFWQWDPVTGTRLIPNMIGRFVKAGLFDVTVKVNSQGFRDGEHAYAKRAGTSRIVLLGDSFLEALQVPFEESITPLLAYRLRARGIDVETINLGISGFGTAREYLMLREYGLRYHPDLVVLFFLGIGVSRNSRQLQGLPYVPYPTVDASGALARDSAGRPRFAAFADQVSRLGSVTGLLRKHSRAYRLVKETIQSSPRVHAVLHRLGLSSEAPEPARAGPGLGFYEIYRPELRPAWAEAWRLTEDMLLATRELAEDGGARFGVVIVPAAWEVYLPTWEAVMARLPEMRAAGFDPDTPSRRLAGFLSEHGIEHAVLLGEFRRRARDLPLLYVPDDGHWTAGGHRLAAELLEETVTAWLSGPKPVSGR